MTQVQTPVRSSKKAATNGDKAKGSALAVLVLKYIEGEVAAEEKKADKLKRFVRDIHALTRDGHVAFRAALQEQLDLITATYKAGEVRPAQMQGYSIESFRVMASNFKTISTSSELGFNPFLDDGAQKSWSLSLSECVAMKHAHAAAGTTSGPQSPTARVGRPRKAIKAATPAGLPAAPDMQTAEVYKMPSAQTKMGSIKKALAELTVDEATQVYEWLGKYLSDAKAVEQKAA